MGEFAKIKQPNKTTSYKNFYRSLNFADVTASQMVRTGAKKIFSSLEYRRTKILQNLISCINKMQKLQWSFCYNPYEIDSNKRVFQELKIFFNAVVKNTIDFALSKNEL